MNKKVVYTCIVDHYDTLRQPLVTNDQYDYICFSNDWKDGIKVGIWEIRKIPFQCENKTILSRYVKILPHEVLGEYEYSVWMDANLQITGKEFYDKLQKAIDSKVLIALVPHLERNCVYDELEFCFWAGLIKIGDYAKQWSHLHLMGFPKQYGLFENNIIYRKHNSEIVIPMDILWWREFSKFAHRDQLHLSPVLSKYKIIPNLLFGPKENSRNVECILYSSHFIRRIQRERSDFENFIYRVMRWCDRHSNMAAILLSSVVYGVFYLQRRNRLVY